MPVAITTRGEDHGLSRVSRHEIIDAIADLAIAARAGELVRAYQREWAWLDKQNYRDAVDADEFNEAFHGIEREFDKLAQTLGLGERRLPPPDYDSGEVELAEEIPLISLRHGLDSLDLLIDFRIKTPEPGHTDIPVFTLAGFWRSPIQTDAYFLTDRNTIVLFGPAHSIVRVLIWKW